MGEDASTIRRKALWKWVPILVFLLFNSLNLRQLLLISRAVIGLHSTSIAVLLIGLGLLFCMGTITSFKILGINFFGNAKAGFTALASSYSLLQVFAATFIVSIVDRYGFAAVFVVGSVCTFASIRLLQATLSSVSRSQLAT